MLVLIATDELQRSAHVDNHMAVEGELVTPVVVGCADVRCSDCQGSWFGLVSHGGTPTAMVVDRPGVSEADLRRRVHDWLDCMGIIDRVVQASEVGEFEVDGVRVTDPVAAVDELVSDHIDEICQICDAYPAGTVVSRLGSLVARRDLDLAA